MKRVPKDISCSSTLFLGETLFVSITAKTTLVLLLTAIAIASVFQIGAGVNDFKRIVLVPTVFQQRNIDFSPLLVSEDSKVFVQPKDSIYYAWEKRMNDTLSISVMIANMTSLKGLSFKLTWDPELLDCTSITENLFQTVTPNASWSNIWSVKLSYNNSGGYADYAQTWKDFGQAVLDGYAPANITTADYPEGKLAAAIVTFKVVKMPPLKGYVDTFLHLSFVQSTDADGNVILVEVADGYYKLISPTGDMNGDHIVDIYDAILFSGAFGSSLGTPSWNPKADLNSDDTIDIFDALVLAGDFGGAV
jgi:hypothetical protein